MANLSVLILAAGKGVRMKSNLPKVLHPVGSTSMVGRVLASVFQLKPFSVGLVVGHNASQVESHVRSLHPRVKFFHQNVLDGSGGAVKRTVSWLKKISGDVIVTCGDTPLLTSATLRSLIAAHKRDKNPATVLTTKLETPFGYGRIVRGFDGRVVKITEELEATPEERKIHEINTGTYCFDAKALVKILPKLKANNKKKEFYLTDVLEILNLDGQKVGAVLCDDSSETLGINSRNDLAKALFALNKRNLETLMVNGVTVIDPATTYVDESVQVGVDTILWPQTFLKGTSKIGSGCEIGPWAFVKDTQIENNVILRASFTEGGVVKSGARVGPYSRIRPGSVVGRDVHLGNFSEVKNSHLGEGSKVNHLSYLGDAKLGKNVNIGAGTITCNYDGIKKFPTFVQDHAFIGSNVNLIAPIKIGAHAVVGAGSSLNEDVPAWALSVERSETVVRKNWARKKYKKGT